MRNFIVWPRAAGLLILGLVFMLSLAGCSAQPDARLSAENAVVSHPSQTSTQAAVATATATATATAAAPALTATPYVATWTPTAAPLPSISAQTATPAAAEDPNEAVSDEAWSAQLDQLMDQAAQGARSTGLVIGVREGTRPMVIRGYGLTALNGRAAISADTPFQIASITKQFTAAAILQLVEAGKISLDNPVSRFFPDLPDAAQQVTLRNLLTHTSGLPDVVGWKIRSYGVEEAINPGDSQVDLAAVFANPQAAPGTQYAYNNTGFYILGRIIEQVSGEDYASYMKRHIFDPLGLAQTSFCTDAPVNAAQGYGWDAASQTAFPLKNDLRLVFSAGGLCSSARDLLTWQQALASGSLISPESYQAMTQSFALADGSLTQYGFGESLGTINGEAVVYHGGALPGFRSLLLTFPARDLTIVVLANAETVDPMQIAQEIAR